MDLISPKIGVLLAKDHVLCYKTEAGKLVNTALKYELNFL